MWGELRYAARVLVKNPGFSAVVVVALALGIGAATTSFSAVNALLLRPWPYVQDQDRLLFVSEYFPKQGREDNGVAYPDYLDYKRQATKTLEGIGTVTIATMILSDGDRPERYLGAFVTADAFSLLGVQPLLGRTFRADEDQPSAAPVALLGYDAWKNHFGADRSVIGRVVTINGKRVTIVGVMPPGWRFPETTDLWMPLQIDEKENPRGSFNFWCFARLRPGATIAQARTELESVAARMAADHPQTNAGCTAYVRPFREQIVKDARKLTLLLMGAVVFVHLIACANVANLLLARGATRQREIGIRLALGANRTAITRQLLSESVLLGAAGSALGLLLATWGVDLMVRAIPVELPYWLHFEFDWRVCFFAIALGLGSAVVFGLFPALQASRPQLLDTLREGGRAGSGGGKAQHVRHGLIVAEVALALVLLLGAGLMVRSFLKLQSTKVGIDPSDTLTFRVGLPPSQFKAEEAARFFNALMPKLAAIPGVKAAGAVSGLPAAGNVGNQATVLEGEAEPERLQSARMSHPIAITPGYLTASGISLLRGRDIAISDNENSARVVLIDENGARQWFPNADAIGHQLRLIDKLGEPPKWATIVGVVGNVIYDRLVQRRPTPCVYVSEYQRPENFLSGVLRTRGNPSAFTSAVRDAVLSVNKDIPIYRVHSMEEVVAESFWERRFFGSLFAVFSLLALFLASIGLYGVLAYSVRQRTQEIGVRMALGAQAADVFRLITRHGVRLIALGLLIGLVGALFLTRLLAGSLEGVSTHDPLSFIIVPLVLSIVGLLACFLPARAAMQLNPVEALRHE